MFKGPLKQGLSSLCFFGKIRNKNSNNNNNDNSSFNCEKFPPWEFFSFDYYYY